jgi:antitoxin (DNA-binding transcriptional repressor) of toxin-antitoxin stability system
MIYDIGSWKGSKAMREMSLREFRQVMGVIDDVLAAHGELILTRHGRPIAKVVPLPDREPFIQRATGQSRTGQMVLSNKR